MSTQIKIVTDTPPLFKMIISTSISRTVTEIIFKDERIKVYLNLSSGPFSRIQIKMINELGKQSIQNRMSLNDQTRKLNLSSYNSIDCGCILSPIIYMWETQEQYLIDTLKDITGITDF